jgi:hypothetical protein
MRWPTVGQTNRCRHPTGAHPRVSDEFRQVSAVIGKERHGSGAGSLWNRADPPKSGTIQDGIALITVESGVPTWRLHAVSKGRLSKVSQILDAFDSQNAGACALYVMHG